MTTSPHIEWVEFQVRTGVTEAQFLAVSDAFQTEFLDLQPGYLERTVVRLPSQGHYADLVHWSAATDMQAAMDASASFPACQAYFSLLTVTKPQSLGAAIAHHMGPTGGLPTAPAVSPVGGLEFSLFRPKHGVSDHALTLAAADMANGLYRGQAGYYGHKVMKTSQGVYADVVFASSGRRAAELCGLWGTGPYADACLPYLELIDPSSIDLAFYDTLT